MPYYFQLIGICCTPGNVERGGRGGNKGWGSQGKVNMKEQARVSDQIDWNQSQLGENQRLGPEACHTGSDQARRHNHHLSCTGKWTKLRSKTAGMQRLNWDQSWNCGDVVKIRLDEKKLTTWILVRQEVHTLGIGTGNGRSSRIGPTSYRTNIHFVNLKYFIAAPLVL